MSSWAGDLIFLARRTAKLSQRELAQRAKTSQAAIASYESGKRSPTLETLQRVVGAAGKELRIRLVDYDDHDEWIKGYEQNLPAEVRAERRRKDAEILREARRRQAEKAAVQ